MIRTTTSIGFEPPKIFREGNPLGVRQKKEKKERGELQGRQIDDFFQIQ